MVYYRHPFGQVVQEAEQFINMNSYVYFLNYFY